MKSNSKIGFSPLRVIVALFITGFLTAVLLVIDNAVEHKLDYSDLNPVLTRDGKEMIFIRWFWRQDDRVKLMEMWKAHSDGSDPSKLYSFNPEFHIYGLRFFRLSEDGKSILARLMLKDPQYDYNIRDFFFTIPLGVSSGKPVITELPKTSSYDMILDCRDDTILARRVGDEHENNVVFMSRYDFRIVSSFSYPKGFYCNSGMLYNGSNNALVLLERDGILPDYTLIKLKKGLAKSQVELKVKGNLLQPVCLSSRKQFVSVDRNAVDSFLLIDENLSIVKQIPNPFPDRNAVFEMTVSPDERFILHSYNNRICRLDMDTGNTELMSFPVDHIVPPVKQNPVNRELVFSDGKQLFSSRFDGSGLKALTELSPKSRLEKNKTYMCYREIRERCFTFICHLLGIACEENEKEHDERDHVN